MKDDKQLERVARRMRMQPYALNLFILQLSRGQHMQMIGLTYHRLLGMYDRAFNSMKVYQQN